MSIIKEYLENGEIDTEHSLLRFEKSATLDENKKLNIAPSSLLDDRDSSEVTITIKDYEIEGGLSILLHD